MIGATGAPQPLRNPGARSGPRSLRNRVHSNLRNESIPLAIVAETRSEGMLGPLAAAGPGPVGALSGCAAPQPAGIENP